MSDSYKRLQLSLLQELLRQLRVVVVHGARQTGKTTLCLMPEVGEGRRYLSLDDLDVLEAARKEPASLWAGADYVTLDEVQKCPELLSAIKLEVDREPRPGRFLLTGSANLLLMKQVSESLAGRAVYLPLPPMLWPEIERRPSVSTLADILASADAASAAQVVASRMVTPIRRLPDAITAGGYPSVALIDDPAFHERWFESYVQTYLERDLRDLSALENLLEFRLLMRLVAARPGALQNAASLGREARLPAPTARRYLALMETTFQYLRVPAFSLNRGKQLVKSPKSYWSDTGLGRYLEGGGEFASPVPGPGFGPWLEAWVAIHLQAFAELILPRPRLSHWRTNHGIEVNFVLEWKRRLLPIEVKSSRRVTSSDLAGLETFLALHPEAPFGVVVCQREEPMLLRSNILALPIETLLLT
jgi:predicted AAA+ superfamily ATPase